jgi:DNA-binding response OmpR family regulator
MANDTRVEPRSGGLRVLVLDDDEDTADSLSQLVSCWGHNPFTAYDAASAIELGRLCRPDVALLDLWLRSESGYEVAQHLRRQAESKDVVLIAVTGCGDPEARRQSLVYGFAHYLVKPVDPELLEKLLAALHERLIGGLPRPRKTKGTMHMLREFRPDRAGP